MAKDRVDAVDRALSILDSFKEEDRALSLKEISDRTGFYKSTILRLIGSLKAFGYVTQDAGGYSLGSTVWRLGSLYRERYPSADVIVPALQRLRDKLGETASFYVREGDIRICLYRENSKRPMRHFLEQGARLPLEQGAAGRLLLAYDGKMPADGKDAQDLRLKEYAVSLGERHPEIAAVAVPVHSKAGVFVGAMSLSGLVTRFDAPLVDACLSALKGEADGLTESLV